MESSADTEVITSMKYPRGVFFISVFEFCQRYCLYGMRSVLAIFLVSWLGHSEDTATTLYHTFVALCFSAPIIGAIIADSWLGRFKTIILVSLFYLVGISLLFTSTLPIFSSAVALAYVGIFLTGFGNGAISPCVSAFGADQFQLPEQKDQQRKFFSIYYVTMSLASFIATIVSPILRSSQCFGETDDNCYSLSFGVSAAFLLFAIVVLTAGTTFYQFKPPGGNVLLKVVKCMAHGMKMKLKSRGHVEKRIHWLDYADDKYDKTLIADTKLSLNILSMFKTLPIFWALYDQKGSRWTFQASRMKCDFGSWRIFPDQMQLWSPLLLVVMIPLFEVAVYPLFRKLKVLQTPLRKMLVGGLLAGLAFLISALVEVAIQPTNAVVPFRAEAQLRIINTLNCSMNILADNGDFEIGPMDAWQNLHISTAIDRKYIISVKTDETLCAQGSANSKFLIDVVRRKSQSYAIYYGNETKFKLKISEPIFDEPEKSPFGNGKVRIILKANSQEEVLVVLEAGKELLELKFSGEISSSEITDLKAQEYRIRMNNDVIGKAFIGPGGVYTLVINQETGQVVQHEITPESTVSVFWLVPQYFIMTAAEILFSITGLEFAFTQAPPSMKTVIVSGWLITVAFGNIIVIFIAGARFFRNMVWENLLFASWIFICMIIFGVQSLRYRYVESTANNENKEEKESQEEVNEEPKDSSEETDKKGI